MGGVVVSLLEKGADPNGDSYLHDAIVAMQHNTHLDYWPVIRALLRKGMESPRPRLWLPHTRQPALMLGTNALYHDCGCHTHAGWIWQAPTRTSRCKASVHWTSRSRGMSLLGSSMSQASLSNMGAISLQGPLATSSQNGTRSLTRSDPARWSRPSPRCAAGRRTIMSKSMARTSLPSQSRRSRRYCSRLFSTPKRHPPHASYQKVGFGCLFGVKNDPKPPTLTPSAT